MNKTKTILISVFVMVAIGFGITTAVLINQPAKQTASEHPQASQTLAAETNNENQLTFMAEANKNVLDQTKEKATIEVKDSAYGPYVESINGKVGGTDGKYWTFYVDGTMAQVGAGEYITHGGETIEWKFE